MKSKEISGKTLICGVIGDPIEHTMSPAMHNAAFQTLGLDYVYLAFHVKPADLKQTVAGMKALNIRGLNVTIPHKTAVIPLLDEVDEMAAHIGAVNTIINENGKLAGYNTDAPGFLEALTQHDVEPAGKKVVLLGAGGAAHAIAFILAENQAKLVILNRKEEIDWAYDIVKNIKEHYSINIKVDELNPASLASSLSDADILVNATSVGMYPDDGKSLVPAELHCSSLTVFDAVYNPLPTKLLKEAKARGAQTIDGLEMLVWQGVLAFEKWTGVHPPADVMRQAAMKVLKK